jgi:hypothetical protein
MIEVFISLSLPVFMWPGWTVYDSETPRALQPGASGWFSAGWPELPAWRMQIIWKQG